MTAPYVPPGGYSSDPNYVPPAAPVGFYDAYNAFVAKSLAPGYVDPAIEAHRAAQSAASVAANAIAAENDRLAAIKSMRDAGGLFAEDRARLEAAGVTYGLTREQGDAFWAGAESSDTWGKAFFAGDATSPFATPPPLPPADTAPPASPVITSETLTSVIQANDRSQPIAVRPLMANGMPAGDPAVSLTVSPLVFVTMICALMLGGYYLFKR